MPVSLIIFDSEVGNTFKTVNKEKSFMTFPHSAVEGIFICGENYNSIEIKSKQQTLSIYQYLYIDIR